jgi:hypothetical protein
MLSQEDYERQVAGGQTSATFELRLPATFDLQTLVDALEHDGAVRSVRIQQL